MGLSFAFADFARDLSSNLSRGDYFLELFAIYLGMEPPSPRVCKRQGPGMMYFKAFRLEVFTRPHSSGTRSNRNR